MSGEELSQEWLDLAKLDLSAAEFLMDMRPVPVEIICYHCEQAAEKFLKGVLVHHDIEAPKTHDLLRLCKMCSELDRGYEQIVDACVELTPYGVQVRYPSDLELTESDMHCALAECRKISAFVFQKITEKPETAPTM